MTCNVLMGTLNPTHSLTHSSSRPWARRWRTTNVCDMWPVWRQTYGYLSSHKASPPIGWYQIILLGVCWQLAQGCIWQRAAWIQTRDLE